MPLYDFQCRACGHVFEALVRHSTDPECPACRSSDLERLPSLFAVDSTTTRAAAVKDGHRQITKLERSTAAQRREVIKKHGD
jgi:putative FmdB family regulatory protein